MGRGEDFLIHLPSTVFKTEDLIHNESTRLEDIISQWDNIIYLTTLLPLFSVTWYCTVLVSHLIPPHPPMGFRLSPTYFGKEFCHAVCLAAQVPLCSFFS